MVIKLFRVVAPVPPFATGTVPVRISTPSIVTTPALERANVVSDACPNSIAVNWGESSVPTPRAEAAAEAEPAPVPPRAIASVPMLTLLAFNWLIPLPSAVTILLALTFASKVKDTILPVVCKEVELFVNVILFVVVAPKSVTS